MCGSPFSGSCSSCYLPFLAALAGALAAFAGAFAALAGALAATFAGALAAALAGALAAAFAGALDDCKSSLKRVASERRSLKL